MNRPTATIVIREVQPGRYIAGTKGVSSYHDGEWVSHRSAEEIAEYLRSIDARATPHIFLPGDTPDNGDNAVDLEDAIDFFEREAN